MDFIAYKVNDFFNNRQPRAIILSTTHIKNILKPDDFNTIDTDNRMRILMLP